MAEQNNLNTPKIEGQEAPKDAISVLGMKLGISDNAMKEISTLSQDKKEELEVDLTRIQKEVEEKKLGNTERDQKIKNTLAGEYGIILLTDKTSQTVVDKENNKTEEEKKNEKKYKELGERLTKVKELDPTIVSEELANAKAKNPLPENAKLAIAKASNIEPSKIDEAIQKNDNPQIKNLVDTYYLTNPDTQSAIEKRLPETKLGDANIAFQELRASARDFPGILSPFTPKDLPSRLSDKSDATQGKVIETVNSLTKGAPDTLITRSGDRLNWEDARGSQYEIDMAVRPPRLTKSQNGLSIYRDVESISPEQKEKQELESKKSKIKETVITDAARIKLSKTEDIPDSMQDTEILKQYQRSQEAFDGAKNPTEKLEALHGLKEQNRIVEQERRGNLNIENMNDPKYAKFETALFNEANGLNQLELSLSQYVKNEKELEKYKSIKTNKGIESFDDIASNNLSYLVDGHFDRLGPDANEALYRIVDEINRTRTANNQINLSEPLDRATDGVTLRKILEKIGGTQDVLISGDKLPSLQNKISLAIQKSPDKKDSIESLMNA